MLQCPCCDHVTLDARGQYEICPVCSWEDDGLDVDAPDARSGPNSMSLRDGRRNFERVGACEARHIVRVVPAPQRSRFRHEARSIAGAPRVR